jgi:hypothetical protein
MNNEDDEETAASASSGEDEEEEESSGEEDHEEEEEESSGEDHSILAKRIMDCAKENDPEALATARRCCHGRHDLPSVSTRLLTL